MAVGVIDPAELSLVGEQRGGQGVTAVVRDRVDAADAVEDQIHLEPGGRLPLQRTGHIGCDHSHDRVCRAVVFVGDVVGAVPTIVADEHVIDVQGEVVALVAQIYASRDPVDQAVSQEQRVHLVGVVGDRDHQLFKAIGAAVHAHDRRRDPAAVDRTSHEGCEGRRTRRREGRRVIAVRAGVDLHGTGQVAEHRLASRRELRRRPCQLAGKEGPIQAVLRGWVGISDHASHAKARLIGVERRPLASVERGEATERGALQETSRRQNNRLIPGVCGARRQRRGRDGAGRLGDDGVKRHALALQRRRPRLER